MNTQPKSRSSKQIGFALKLAAAMVGSALLLTLARAQGWIDQDVVMRAYNVIMGLTLAVYANFLPKLMDGTTPRSIHEATLAQVVGRVTGWSMMLAFLIWAALWAFAPLSIARTGSIAAVILSVLVTLAFIAWTATHRRTPKGNPPTDPL